MTPATQKPQPNSAANYSVGVPEVGVPEVGVLKVGVRKVGAARRKVAVFVAHGMGQQIPFQTLDQVAEGLRQKDIAEGNDNPDPIANTLKSGEQWLRRIELQLKSGDNALEAHVYEAYWAPLTEGKISAGGVIRFLAGAGQNGLQNAMGKFKRWMFNEYEEYPTPIRTVLYLLIALATVASLVEMNSAIAVVVAGRALLAQRPGWLTNGLFADLTTTFNAVVTTMAAIGLSLALARLASRKKLNRRRRQVWGWLTVVLFGVTVLIVILAGIAIAALFYGHVRGGAGPDTQLWYQLFSTSGVAGFNRAFDWLAWRITIVVAIVIAIWWIFKIAMGVYRDFRDSRGGWLTLLVASAFAVLVVLAFLLVLAFYEALKNPSDGNATVIVISGLAWPLLIAASSYIRKILIQYVGDVAIYVTAHTLDSFNDVRKEIKKSVHDVAQSIYSLNDKAGKEEYKEVIVVGHSLGSVIVYDALNQLINEDISNANALTVVERTKLLLTFGSPLDKTAFIFGMQAKDTSEAREALAASVQPLIRDYSFRPKQWINIYSPWDIISGSLGLYDPRNSTDSRRVGNIADPDATTFLIAHTEYWGNPLVVETIYNAL